jgi:hypothetical protein
LNSDASDVRKKKSSVTIVADVKRFIHQINTDARQKENASAGADVTEFAR